ncbi:hypothetical protein ACEPAH_6746 [Sanghuangporus vaninii]
MAIGHPIPHHDHSHQRRGTMFPGRELPPPIPSVADPSDWSNLAQFSLPDRQPMHYPHVHVHTPSAVPPPPSSDVAHKVWMLNCKHCGNFITNRGMKCVLLLRPDVHLFSSDAMPVNCSVYQINSESPRMRTCECLSQTLCCHGCGAAMGYMIVAPCARCAPGMSFTPANPYSPSPPRNTNGHRFVFHASEVDYEERLYVAGDPDVSRDARSQEVFAAFSHQMQSMPSLHLPKIPRLTPGEILYWHHFTRAGDMMGGVRDDVRARASRGYRFDPVNGGRSSRIMACR